MMNERTTKALVAIGCLVGALTASACDGRRFQPMASRQAPGVKPSATCGERHVGGSPSVNVGGAACASDADCGDASSLCSGGNCVAHQATDAANGCLDTNAPCRTLQRALDVACVGDRIRVAAGTYDENLVIRKRITFEGAGPATIIRPGASSPKPCDTSSLCDGAASNIILVESHDVTIESLTLDGDNQSLTSGVIVGGADIDARNGIVTNHLAGTFENLTVKNVTVKNVFFRGIYAAGGGSFKFESNSVSNVRGHAESIAIFNYGGKGSMVSNRVDGAETAFATMYSRGVVIAYNTVAASLGGIHSYYAGESGASTADQVLGNRIAGGLAGGTGILVVAAAMGPEVTGNIVNGAGVGLALFGDFARAAHPVFTRNVVDGRDSPTSVGVLISTDGRAAGSSNVGAAFVANRIHHNAVGVRVIEQGGRTNRAELRCNVVTANLVGIEVGTPHVLIERNTVAGNRVGIDGTAIRAGTLAAHRNYWGCVRAPGPRGCDRTVGPVDPAGALTAAEDCAK